MQALDLMGNWQNNGGWDAQASWDDWGYQGLSSLDSWYSRSLAVLSRAPVRVQNRYEPISERTLEILEWLQEVSRDHQVIVFSQEAQVAEWASERLHPDIDAFVGLADAGSASDGHADLT